MGKMKLARGFLTLVLLGFNAGGICAQTPMPAVERETRAKELWELAIAAKGGREKLRDATSLLVTYGKTHTLGVFPSWFWEWEDSRPSPLGLSVQVYNLASNRGYYLGGRMKKGAPRTGTQYARERLFQLQLMFLMETNWVNPIPYDYAEEVFDGETVDVVYAQVEQWKVSYLLDKRTHLPLAFRHHVKVDRMKLPTGHVIQEHEAARPIAFAQYVNVDGIQVPSKVCYDSKTPWIGHLFLFNVDYDPRVFERPPSREDGPDAWRRLPKPVVR